MGWNLLSAKKFHYAQLWVKGYLHARFGPPSPNSVDFHRQTKSYGRIIIIIKTRKGYSCWSNMLDVLCIFWTYFWFM